MSQVDTQGLLSYSEILESYYEENSVCSILWSCIRCNLGVAGSGLDDGSFWRNA